MSMKRSPDCCWPDDCPGTSQICITSQFFRDHFALTIQPMRYIVLIMLRKTTSGFTDVLAGSNHNSGDTRREANRFQKIGGPSGIIPVIIESLSVSGYPGCQMNDM